MIVVEAVYCEISDSCWVNYPQFYECSLSTDKMQWWFFVPVTARILKLKYICAQKNKVNYTVNMMPYPLSHPQSSHTWRIRTARFCIFNSVSPMKLKNRIKKTNTLGWVPHSAIGYWASSQKRPQTVTYCVFKYAWCHIYKCWNTSPLVYTPPRSPSTSRLERQLVYCKCNVRVIL